MKTAVVILNYNGAAMLRQFLPSVLQYSQNAQVIVADNSSTDDSRAVLAQEFPEVQVITLDENYGFAEGYNRALAQVDTTYAVLLNSDVKVTEHWLEPLENYMDANPEVAACQPKIRAYHHPTYFEYAGACGGYMDKYGYPFCRGRIVGTVEKDEGQYDSIRSVFWATGAALCIRLDIYKAVGGLDGRFFAHMEEIDLCWRLRSRGYQIACIPQSTVFHVGGATLKKENPRKTFLNFRNNLLMLYKNLPEAELKDVMRVRCLLDYVAYLQFLLKGDLGNAQAVFKARRKFHQIKKQFTRDRQENLALAQNKSIPERYSFLLIWQYYAKGIKKFSQLSL